MGVVVSRIWSTHTNFEYDSTTGLSGEEKALLTENFNALKTDLSKSGARLFILYFQDYPENKQYFRDFRNKTIEELETSPLLIAHGTNVMCSLSGIIMNLNEPETLVALITKIGYGHGKRNIKPQALLDLKATILKLLQEKLKNKYTSHVEEVWSKTIDIIATTFQAGAQKYLDEKNND